MKHSDSESPCYSCVSMHSQKDACSHKEEERVFHQVGVSFGQHRQLGIILFQCFQGFFSCLEHGFELTERTTWWRRLDAEDRKHMLSLYRCEARERTVRQQAYSCLFKLTHCNSGELCHGQEKWLQPNHKQQKRHDERLKASFVFCICCVWSVLTSAVQTRAANLLHTTLFNCVQVPTG